MTAVPDITQLLLDLRTGQREVMDALFPMVYDELRQIAHHRLAHRQVGHTLSTTALVHEAYLKLIDQTRARWQDRVHFFAVAARAMRFILIDHARRRQAQKRGSDPVKISLDQVELAADTQAADLLALDEALTRLHTLDERLAQVVEYRFFGGLTIEETAEVLTIAPRTVKRDWQKARLWLYQDMQAA